MIRLAIFLSLAIAWAAHAAPVLVKSGEHDGFTRLVMEYGGPVEWMVGRSGDGYQLRIAGAMPNYDLTDAFKAIGKSRLAGIAIDPATGDLQFSMACGCYAIPFEFRPGIVVIDLRDGKAPKGSSFELALDQSTQHGAAPTHSAAANTYDWTDSALAQLDGGRPQTPTAESLAPTPSSEPSLQALRESLLHQMSRGASQGMVDMAKLEKSPEDHIAQSQKPDSPKPETQASESHAPVKGDAFEAARIGLGELPGVEVSSGLPDHAELGAQGQGCIGAEHLAFASWGSDKPVSEQMAAVTSGLIGEFDRPNPEALQNAIRFHLFIGFGAEVRQLMAAFPSDLADQKIWYSLAHLVDDRPDPNSAFLGQEACDSPAALWAILAQPNLQRGQPINVDAAFLALSALPIDLRRSIGSMLADRFMAMGYDKAAKKVRDAILRSPNGGGPKTVLLEAKIDMADGDAAEAEEKLQEMVADPGPETSAALVALVEARVAQDLPIAPDMVVALTAVLQEQTGTLGEAAAQRALLLAKAASGDMDGAFAMLPEAPEMEPKVWRILSILGTDDALLSHAVLMPDAKTPQLDAPTRRKLAERLLALGMTKNALHWQPDESQADPTFMAQIQLHRQDGAAALRALTGIETPEALAMRAQALNLLGENAAAAQVYAQAGDADAEMRALGLAQHWQDLSARGPDGWKQVADHVVTPVSLRADSVAVGGPLAMGKALVDESAATRAAVDALLAKVAAP
jgi:tetratricopeptide (TPR) repeat protein